MTGARRIGLGLTLALFAAGHLAHAHYFRFVTDDAYISLRYVQNLLYRGELTYNPGVFVEGYSNLSWVLQLALAGLVGFDPVVMSQVLGCAYSVGVLALVVLLLGEFHDGRWWTWWAVVPVSLLAAHREFAVWATGGLETRSWTFFVLLGLLGYVRMLGGKVGAPLAALGWSLAVLTRPDAGLLFLAGLGFVVLLRRDRREALLAGGPVVAVLALHTAFRWFYYGDLLPNTYYAKITDPWWSMGSRWEFEALVEFGVWLPLLTIAAGATIALRSSERRLLGLFGVVSAAHLIYLARIGGDHFEYRLLDPLWPLLYVSFTAGLRGLSGKARSPAFSAATVAILLTAALLYGSAIPWLAEREARTFSHYNEAIGKPLVLDMDGAGAWRLLPGLPPLVRAWNALQKRTVPYSVGTRQHEHRMLTAKLMAQFAPLAGLRAAGHLPDDTVSVAEAAGVIAYYADITVIDVQGLTDREIARLPPAPGPRILVHERDPSPEYLASRGVNFVAPMIVDRIPGSTQENLYVFELEPGRYLGFLSDDRGWVERNFELRPVIFGGEHREPAQD